MVPWRPWCDFILLTLVDPLADGRDWLHRSTTAAPTMAQGPSNKNMKCLKSSVAVLTLLGWLRSGHFAWRGEEPLFSLSTAYHLRPSGQVLPSMGSWVVDIMEQNASLLLFTRVHVPQISQYRRPPAPSFGWTSNNVGTRNHSLEGITQTYASPTDPLPRTPAVDKSSTASTLYPPIYLHPPFLTSRPPRPQL